MTDDVPTFDIPRRPERVYPRDGGVEYEGGTVFMLSPDFEVSEQELVLLVEGILDGDGYTYGDWFELPAPVYLVHDEHYSTAFRVVIRSGAVEFHVLPDTVSDGLRALYVRLRDAVEWAWSVESETTRPE